MNNEKQKYNDIVWVSKKFLMNRQPLLDYINGLKSDLEACDIKKITLCGQIQGAQVALDLIDAYIGEIINEQ